MLHTKARYVGEMFCFVASAFPLSVSSSSTRPRSLAPGIAANAAKTLGRARASLSGECFLLCPYFERTVSGCREIEATLWAPTGDFCFYLRDDVLHSAFVCLLPRSSVVSQFSDVGPLVLGLSCSICVDPHCVGAFLCGRSSLAPRRVIGVRSHSLLLSSFATVPHQPPFQCHLMRCRLCRPSV